MRFVFRLFAKSIFTFFSKVSCLLNGPVITILAAIDWVILFGRATTMLKRLKALWRGEDAATLAEYGLLLALIAVIVIGALKVLGTNISTMFSNVAGSI